MVAIVELDSFKKSVKKLLSNEDVKILKEFLAANPKAGDVIRQSGGIRKLRWKINNNKGKSGGSRIIYYFANEEIPLLLIFCYPKNEQENITDKQREFFKKLILDFYK